MPSALGTLLFCRDDGYVNASLSTLLLLLLIILLLLILLFIYLFIYFIKKTLTAHSSTTIYGHFRKQLS